MDARLVMVRYRKRILPPRAPCAWSRGAVFSGGCRVCVSVCAISAASGRRARERGSDRPWGYRPQDPLQSISAGTCAAPDGQGAEEDDSNYSSGLSQRHITSGACNQTPARVYRVSGLDSCQMGGRRCEWRGGTAPLLIGGMRTIFDTWQRPPHPTGSGSAGGRYHDAGRLKPPYCEAARTTGGAAHLQAA